MSELLKTILDFKQRKKYESDKAYARFEIVLNSTHTALEVLDATVDYAKASSEYMAVSDLLAELTIKGLI